MFKIIRNFIWICIILGIFGLAVAWLYAKKLENEYDLDNIASSGALWSIPARVYARPLDIHEGKLLHSEDLVKELNLLGFQKVDNVAQSKQYSVKGNEVIYYAPLFYFTDGERAARRIKVTFNGDKVSKVYNLTDFKEVTEEKLNPYHIANIYPQQKEDRLLVKLNEVPPLLIDSLILTEDRKFRSHIGIDVKGLARAVYVMLVKKGHEQGASTITQQFIKNHFLTNERRISRKIKEMLMAIVLERHATKDQILEGYINEIYLGQDGSRAIHGFGLASEYYFNKSLVDLDLDQIAMLVALVREPGSANPRTHPKAALERRDFILGLMQAHNLISKKDEEIASKKPLGLNSAAQNANRIQFPAFVDLVYKQLFDNYKKSDLISNDGINIFTTLDPIVQVNAQTAVTNGLSDLEKSRGLKSNFLQAASVVVNPKTAEIKAIVGSRTAGEQGFNRAISASRQIGSTIKPAVYLTALEYPSYSLATLIDNQPVEYKVGSDTWMPKNYSSNSPAYVILINALVHSYNVSTVKIALNIGIDNVVDTLKRLGFPHDIPANPSVALGAVQMTPLEVAQIYNTYANGGYYTPLRTINEITDAKGHIVNRFGNKSRLAIYPKPYYLLVTAMQQVVQRGTGRRVYQTFDRNLHIAGKTGTTNDDRDAWFSGFTGNNLAVTWVGNDQNLKTGLTGSSGGIPIWSDIMKTMPQEPLKVQRPQGIIYSNIDVNTGLVAGVSCDPKNVVEIPFILGTQPTEVSNCYYDFLSSYEAPGSGENNNTTDKEEENNDFDFEELKSQFH